MQFNVYLHDTTSGTDTLIDTQNLSINGIGGGRSARRTLRVTLPPGTAPGTYQLLVTLNENGAVNESDTTNDTILSDQTIQVS